MERLRLRSSDYKNHRIFSLRCIHKDLIPVSIKLKSTLDTSKARQIIRKAEKDLLQARVKAINNILDQVDRQIQECRAKLASIILAERLGECQDFINKVSELRFTKVKQRQINKLNQLVSKKEGNVALANAVNNITNPINRQASCNSCNPTPANALLPPREGSNPLPATVHLSLEGNSLPNSQANNNNTTNIIGNSANSQANNNNITNNIVNWANSQTQSPNNTLAIAHLPPWGKEAILSQELYTFPRKMTALPNKLFSLPQGRKTILPKLLLHLYPTLLNPLGHPRQGKATTSPGQAGKAIGTLTGHNPTQPSQEACTTSREGNPTSTSPSRANQGSSKEEPNPKWVINLSN